MKQLRPSVWETVLLAGIVAAVTLLAAGCARHGQTINGYELIGSPYASRGYLLTGPDSTVWTVTVDDSNFPMIVETAQTANGSTVRRCAVWMWCAHCNGGQGAYIYQLRVCEDWHGGHSHCQRCVHPGGNKIVPPDSTWF